METWELQPEERRDSRKASAYERPKLGMRWQKEALYQKKLFQGLCWFSSMYASHDRQENV